MMEQSLHARTSWVRLLGLFTFGSFIETLFYGQMTAFTPLYLPHLGVRPEDVLFWTGIIASITGLVGLPFLPFWGALADRYARKPIIIRSFVVHMLVGLACAAAGNIWIFVLGRTLSSLSLGNSGLMMTTLSERTPANRQGLAFSIMNNASPVGVFIGPLIGGPIFDHLGMQALLLIDAGLLIVVVLSLTFGYQDDFKGTDRGPLLSMAAESVRIILRSVPLRSFFPALFLVFAGGRMASTFLPVVVATLYKGQDQGTMVGLVFGAGGAVALVVGPLMGILADRFGHWRVLITGALVVSGLWLLPTITTGLVAFGAAWAVINGLSSGVTSISFMVLSNLTTREERGRVMSFSFLPANVGIILGPSIGSLVTQGSVFAVFPAAAVLTLVGSGLLWVARRR
jgi:MFS transporter, DHA1 family, multidrug resistance protein